MKNIIFLVQLASREVVPLLLGQQAVHSDLLQVEQQRSRVRAARPLQDSGLQHGEAGETDLAGRGKVDTGAAAAGAARPEHDGPAQLVQRHRQPGQLTHSGAAKNKFLCFKQRKVMSCHDFLNEFLLCLQPVPYHVEPALNLESKHEKCCLSLQGYSCTYQPRCWMPALQANSRSARLMDSRPWLV